MNYKDFYSEFGKLMYAVADIDGVITQQEKKEMLDIVKKELEPEEIHKDERGMNTALYSELEFDFLEEEIADAETAFESFIDFIEDHHTALDERMKKTCIKVAEKLAEAYRGTNKKEKLLIQKLKDKLRRI